MENKIKCAGIRICILSIMANKDKDTPLQQEFKDDSEAFINWTKNIIFTTHWWTRCTVFNVMPADQYCFSALKKQQENSAEMCRVWKYNQDIKQPDILPVAITLFTKLSCFSLAVSALNYVLPVYLWQRGLFIKHMFLSVYVFLIWWEK